MGISYYFWLLLADVAPMYERCKKCEASAVNVDFFFFLNKEGNVDTQNVKCEI